MNDAWGRVPHWYRLMDVMLKRLIRVVRFRGVRRRHVFIRIWMLRVCHVPAPVLFLLSKALLIV